MSLVGVTDRMLRPGTDARAARRALRAEKAQLARWRRLLRARLDLTVAGFAPPETLGAMSWELVPEAQMSLPLPQELLDAIRAAGTNDPVALMQRLRSLDRELMAYGAEIDAALEDSTEQIVRRMADSPTAARSDDAR